jgi:hypothetical protein
MSAELRFFSMGAMLLVHGWTVQAGAPPDAVFEFSTPKYTIAMRVTFPPPYEGTRLAVRRITDPTRETCLSIETGTSGCTEHFVGAIAAVGFTVNRTGDGRPTAASIREFVTVLDQTPGLPERPPFAISIKLIEGIGSDLQAFGYDESPVPAAERPAGREAAKAVSRHYRQELYMDKDRKPFAVVEWLHTTTRIRIVRVEPSAPATK